MTLPTLEDLEGGMDRACIDTLGDSIEYKPQGGAYEPLRAYVDFGEVLRDIETGKVIEQDITVELLMTDLDARPSSGDRLTLAKVTGTTFRPVNVRRGNGGSHWLFNVETVNV